METVTINHIFQPVDSNLCGQTCVAMVCGITIDDAIGAVGHTHGTTGPDLHRALNKYGINSSPKIIRKGKHRPLPQRCIAKMRAKGIRESHWILVWDGNYYDPCPHPGGWEYVSGYLDVGGGGDER